MSHFQLLLTGLVVGAVPGLVAAGIASLFVNWVGAGIIGTMVGTPIMIIITALPLLVVKGWVEIFKSSLWTYEYGELNSREPLPRTVEQKKPVLKSTKIASEPAS